MEVRLDQFKHQNHQKKSKLSLAFWLLFSSIFFQSKLPFPMFFKKMILKSFGAKIGSNFTIKTGVTIKYPWKLSVGSNVWIGENVWIDNLDNVSIQNNVCISQGALLVDCRCENATFLYRNVDDQHSGDCLRPEALGM